MFFTINATGLLEIYDRRAFADDYTSHLQRLSHDNRENGQLLAIGSRDGNIYLVECSEGHIINIKSDKENFTPVLKSIIEKDSN